MRTADQRGAPPVLAEPAVSSGGYRLSWAAEWMRERFWVIPAVLLVAGTGLAVLTAEGGDLWHSLGGEPADASWGSGFLESIAGATLTFLGVVFTLTLVAAAVNFGRGRTLYQDPAFGLRQLADIAAQALSPAVNQPTTAVLVIDSLEDVLLQIARGPRHSGCYTDRDGTVRLVKPLPGWEDCLDLAFTEITVYGATAPQVARRLLAAYATLEAAADPARRAGVTALREELARQLASDGTAQQALRADPMGLG
jgi:uncharacterized membrane protein